MTTKIPYLELFRDIIDKHKRHRKFKELKFSSTKKEDVKRLLYDVIESHTKVSIHVKKGTTKKPFDLLTKILNNIKKMHYEVILVLDKNFLTNNNERISLENDGFTVVIRASNVVPGIQVADLVAGAFRLFDKGNRELLNIILSHMCQYSKDSLNTPSVR